MRESRLGADANSLAVSEVRRLTQTGHQTAVITTARQLGNTTIAGRMFARWCQENYFAYMMEHYDIDGLIEYGDESLPGTHQVVNPRWREPVSYTHLDVYKRQNVGRIPEFHVALYFDGHDFLMA